MGYMGFGMRKEDYKRKPKKSFDKLKEIYGNDTPKKKPFLKSPKFTSDEILNRSRIKSLFDTKFFQILKLTFMFSIIGLVLYYAIIQPWLFEKRLASFKQHLINSYSEEHKSLLNASKHLKTLQYFMFDSLDNSYLRTAKGYNVSSSNANLLGPNVVKIGTWDWNAFNIDLNQNELKVIRKDSIQTLKDKWIFIFRSDTIDDQYTRILGLLSIDTFDIEKLRGKLRSSKIGSIHYSDSDTYFKVESSKEFGNYYFIRTNKKMEENTNFIKVDSLTYLKKWY